MPTPRPPSPPAHRDLPATEIVDFDRMALPVSGDFALDAGKVYVLTATKPLLCRLVKRGSGPNPIIRAGLKEEASALAIPFNKAGATAEIDFHLTGERTYAVNNSGTFIGALAVVSGIGGWCKSSGSSGLTRLIDWQKRGATRGTLFWNSALTTRNDAKKYEQRPGAGFELITCIALDGTDGGFGSTVRAHNVLHFLIKLCHFVNRNPLKALLRLHDLGIGALENNTLEGDQNWGPMADGDGGINKPPGPEHDFYAAMRMKRITATDNQFVAPHFDINPGIEDGTIKGGSIREAVDAAIIQTPTYWVRPLSKLKFDGVTCAHATGHGEKGRLFSDVTGAKRMTTTGTTADTKPLRADGSVA